MKYRKKPVVIESFRLGIDNMPDWFMDKVTSNEIILHRIPFDESRAKNYGQMYCEIKTPTGNVRALEGDFIIKRGDTSSLEVCPADANGMLVWQDHSDVCTEKIPAPLDRILTAISCCDKNDTEDTCKYCTDCPIYCYDNNNCYEVLSNLISELVVSLQQTNEELTHIAKTAIACINNCDYSQKYSTNSRLEAAIDEWEASECEEQFYALQQKYDKQNGEV